MKSRLKYLMLLAMFAMLSCNVHGKFTHRRVMRNQESITDIKSYLIKQHKSRISVKDIQDATIKRKLNKLKVEEVNVFPAEFSGFGKTWKDTVVELKTSGFWRYGEILFLVPQNHTIDKILESQHYEYYAPGIYYCRQYFAIS